MRAASFKWLLIGLIVVSFAGRPWAQALAVFSTQGCGGVTAVAMQSAHSTAIHAAGKIAPHETATAKNDAGKPMVADCVKICAAAPMLNASTLAWSADVWPQSHAEAIETALRGHPPKPELAPPIALV
jgi:hypothetical protein